MKGRRTPPRMLPLVMQAIAELKDTAGSSTKRIIDHVQYSLPVKERNITTEIRRAIRHGLKNGVIKQRGGKYRLGLDPQEFALYKSLKIVRGDSRKQHISGGYSKRDHKVKRKSREHRRRRRRRSYNGSDSVDSYETQSISDTEGHSDYTENSEPKDRAKKKSKSHKPHGSQKKPKKRKYHDDDSTESETSKKSHSGEGAKKESKDQSQCNNPDCLCNLNSHSPDECQPSKDSVRGFVN